MVTRASFEVIGVLALQAGWGPMRGLGVGLILSPIFAPADLASGQAGCLGSQKWGPRPRYASIPVLLTPILPLVLWQEPHLPSLPQQFINLFPYAACEECTRAFPPPGFPKSCGPLSGCDRKKGDWQGICPPTSTRLLPSILLTTTSAKSKPWAPARPAGSALPPLPGVAPSLCSPSPPPPPPCLGFCS